MSEKTPSERLRAHQCDSMHACTKCAIAYDVEELERELGAAREALKEITTAREPAGPGHSECRVIIGCLRSIAKVAIAAPPATKGERCTCEPSVVHEHDCAITNAAWSLLSAEMVKATELEDEPPGRTEAPRPCICFHAPERHTPDGCDVLGCHCDCDGREAAPGKTEATPPVATITVGDMIEGALNGRSLTPAEVKTRAERLRAISTSTPPGATALEKAIEGFDTLAERWGEAGGFCTPGDMVRHCSALADLLIAAQREQEEANTLNRNAIRNNRNARIEAENQRDAARQDADDWQQSSRDWKARAEKAEASNARLTGTVAEGIQALMGDAASRQPPTGVPPLEQAIQLVAAEGGHGSALPALLDAAKRELAALQHAYSELLCKTPSRPRPVHLPAQSAELAERVARLLTCIANPPRFDELPEWRAEAHRLVLEVRAMVPMKFEDNDAGEKRT